MILLLPSAQRTKLLFSLLFLLIAGLWGLSGPVSAQEGRTILLGFDGADARTAKELMDAGHLPNLSRLAEQGTFSPLLTTVQAESPVAWASLNTGQNPAKTGIPGFVRRDLASGYPFPTPGHTGSETRALEDLEPGFPIGLLHSLGASSAAGLAGVLVFLVFFVVIGLILRIGRVLAAVLALILGVLGAWGAWAAAGYVPNEVPDIVTNPLKTANFWETAAENGVECIVLDAAMAWDRPVVNGARVLGGLGVPDIRGANGEWYIYTTDDFELSFAPTGRDTDTGGWVYRVDEIGGKIETALYGPKNFWKLSRLRARLAEVEAVLADSTLGYKENNDLRDQKRALEDEIRELEAVRVSVPMVIQKEADSATVQIGAQSQTLKEGAWSDWFHVSFALNPLLKARAVTRVKIVQLDEPNFRMFVDILHIDPSAPPFWQPASQPASFSKDLAGWMGRPFETVGWACITMAFKDGEIDPVTFLQDAEFTMSWREDMTYAALEQNDWRVLFSVFSTTDRVQHMMYQYADPEHPLYDEEKASEKVTFFGQEIELRDAIRVIYQQMDRIVGKVMDDYVQPGDTLMLCADHGFQTFRRGVNVNNWLAENGYLVPLEGLRKNQSSVLGFVDWERTRAYSVGLGMIYLNMKDTHANGTVDPSEKRALMEEIRERLLASTDPETGEPFVSSVAILEDLHSGPYLDLESDLMPGFLPTYRVSWRTTLGGIKLVVDEESGEVVPGPVFEENRENWSGDHVSVDPELVRGIFFSNRPVNVPEDGGVDLLHMAPTVLDLVGVGVPAEYDVAPLQFQPR